MRSSETIATDHLSANLPANREQPLSCGSTKRWACRFENARRMSGLDASGRELFRRLSAMRKKLARERQVPPSQVLTNRQLLDVCEGLPSDEQDLVMCLGLNRFKLLSFGAEILAVVRTSHRKGSPQTPEGSS